MSSRNEFWRSIILFGLCTPFGQLCTIWCHVCLGQKGGWSRKHGLVVGSIERRMFMHIYILLIYIYIYCILLYTYRCIEFCVNTCVRKYVHAFLDFLLYLYMHANVSTRVKCVAFSWFMPSLLLIATKIHASKECDLVDGKLQTTWRLPLGWMAPTAVPLL